MVMLSRERVEKLARDLVDAMSRSRAVMFLKDRESVHQAIAYALADEIRVVPGERAPVCLRCRRGGPQSVIVAETCCGSMTKMTRRSPGWRKGYLSWPRYFLASLSICSSAPSFVTVHPSVPVRSIQELIALAKSKPGQLNYSSAGVGTNPHIAGELFNLLAGVDIVAVQYKGGGPADTAIIAGEVAVTFGNVSQQTAYVKGGRLRALAVTSAKRIAAMLELPTVAEAGVPGYEFETWFVVAAPQRTPRAIVDALNSHIRKVMTPPDQVKLYEERGVTVIASSPEEAAAHLESEQKKWGRVIKERGIKAE